jgi:hypothetical protein
MPPHPNVAVLNSTARTQARRYSAFMSQHFSQTPIADQGFEDRWAAWQARGAASNRATRRTLFIVAAILILSVANLNGLWLLS